MVREYHKGGHSRWQPESLELKPFFEAALESLKQTASALDSKHTTHATVLEDSNNVTVSAQHAASTAQTVSEAAPAGPWSWFRSLKL